MTLPTSAFERRKHGFDETEAGVSEQQPPQPSVYARERAAMPERDDDANFRALLAQARHITGRTYETTLYDHMQAFRLLWHHLEAGGYLERVHDDARLRLGSGAATDAEAADLRLFLTVYARVRGN